MPLATVVERAPLSQDAIRLAWLFYFTMAGSLPSLSEEFVISKQTPIVAIRQAVLACLRIHLKQT
jgi:hypothetical protein